MGCRHCKVDHLAGTRCPAETSAPGAPGASLEGQRHGPLVLRRRLGAGALGSVYLAEYPPTGNRFAVKVLHPHLAVRPGVCARFFAEARAARELAHRHVARVLDARPGPGGLPALLMEYADGEPLSRLPMPLAPVEAVELLGQALAALEAAHARGLVHRELSADNLILTRAADGERRVKVLDFGAAAVLTASLSEEERECGMVVGAPAFIAPEQWTGEAVDGRADLYALGVVGYLLVTGRLPFGFGRVGELAPPQPHELNPCVPAALSAVLLRALAQRPEERFQDARAFRAALDACLAPASAAPEAGEPKLDIDVVVGDLLAVAAESPAAPEAGERVPWGAMPIPLTVPAPGAAERVPGGATPAPVRGTGGVTIFGQALAEDGATPLYLALREAAQQAPTPPPVVEVRAPRIAAPAGLVFRVGLGEGGALAPVEAGDVALDGFFAAWDGVLPPLAARLPVEVTFAGRTVACEGDVVRHVSHDEALTWSVAAGVFVQFTEPGEPLRQLLAAALRGAPHVPGPQGAEPGPDAELARLLSRAASVSGNPYSLLGAPPHVDTAGVHRRAAAALRRLDDFRRKPLPAEQRRALEALRQRVEAARRTLSEPLSRAGYDALRGNLAGLMRCVREGLTEEAVEPLRRAFLTARPDAEARARALFTQGHALEVQHALGAALVRYAEALALDPLNVSWLSHFEVLHQRAHGVVRESAPLSAGAAA
jgi:serine/threonine-protein kinase